MAIADKLTYLNETKSQLLEAINAVTSSGLDGSSTFRSYPDALWDHYITNTLFGSGEQGVWYDPSDLSTLFQDSAGTTPVTADGDPVGLIQDKSGNGNHATQATTASRPVYKDTSGLRSVLPDGVDDTLGSDAYGFSANGWSVFASVTSIGDINIGVSENPDSMGSGAERFVLGSDTGRYKVWSNGKTAGNGDIIPEPDSPHVIGLVCDESGALHYYLDGTLRYSVVPSPAISYAVSLKPGIVANSTLLPDKGVHGIIAVDYDLSVDTQKLNNTMTYLGNLAGVTL